MLNNFDYERAKSDEFIDRSPFLELGMSKYWLDEMTSPRVFATHLPFHLLPDDLNHKCRV